MHEAVDFSAGPGVLLRGVRAGLNAPGGRQTRRRKGREEAQGQEEREEERRDEERRDEERRDEAGNRQVIRPFLQQFRALPLSGGRPIYSVSITSLTPRNLGRGLAIAIAKARLRENSSRPSLISRPRVPSSAATPIASRPSEFAMNRARGR